MFNYKIATTNVYKTRRNPIKFHKMHEYLLQFLGIIFLYDMNGEAVIYRGENECSV